MHSEGREVNISNHICILIARFAWHEKREFMRWNVEKREWKLLSGVLMSTKFNQKNMLYSQVSLSASRHGADTDAFRI